MNPNIRRLYLFHFFNNIAITVVANFVFLDKLFLRMDLTMQHFGFVKGAAWFIPMVINLLLSPLVLRMNRDREIIGIGYIIRVSIPFLLLLLPGLTPNAGLRTVGALVVVVFAMIPPIIANNSIQSLIKVYIPKEDLGKHLGIITLLWTLPGFLLAIPCSYFVDLHSGGTDAEFYRSFLIVMTVTAAFQLPASYFILRMKRPEHALKASEGPVGLSAILEPIKSRQFRPVLNVTFAFGIILAMVTGFINPYLLEGVGLTLTRITVIGAVVSVLSLFVLPLWGRLVDRVGGKNIYRIAVVGLALGIFALVGGSFFFVLVFAVLAWEGSRGFFGAGIYSAQQYLAISFSREERRNIYLAAFTLAQGAGMMLGSIVGGSMLEWIKPMIRSGAGHGTEHFHIYFLFCALSALLISQFAMGIRERRASLRPHQVGMEMYRVARSMFGRNR